MLGAIMLWLGRSFKLCYFVLEINLEVNEGCTLMAIGLYLGKPKALPVRPCQA